MKNEKWKMENEGARCNRASITSALFLWLLLQCLALAFAAARVPFAARIDPPLERFAVHEMILAQMIGAALLLPTLMREGRLSIVIVVTSWPFMQLAAMLAPVATIGALAATGVVSVWLLSLACWSAIARDQRDRLLVAAIFTAIAVGDPLLAYLRVEFAGASSSKITGPVLGAMAQLHTPLSPTSWIVPISLFFISCAIWITITGGRRAARR